MIQITYCSLDYFLFFISLSAFNMGLLNSKSKFFVPAFSPTIFNLGIILVLLSSFYLFDMTISSLAYGVVFGSILQFLYQLPYIYTNNLSYRVSFSNIFNTKLFFNKKFLSKIKFKGVLLRAYL